MRTFLWSHLDHVVAALTFLARLADVGTTWLGTPHLLLEGNPLVRRLGWPFAVATILLPPFLAYWSLGDAVIVLTASFLVAAHNASGIRLGSADEREEEEAEIYEELAEEGPSWTTLARNLMPLILVAPLGMLLLLAYPRRGLGNPVALGILLYVAGGVFFTAMGFFRFRREARQRRAKGLSRDDPSGLPPLPPLQPQPQASLVGTGVPVEGRQSTSV